MIDNSSKINKFILCFITLKILMSLVFFVIMPLIFDRSIFFHDDFGYYISGDFSTGRNIGYRWLLWLLGIKSLNAVLPIFLAFIMNIYVDIVWINLVSKHLNFKGLFLFVLMLGLQPYAAVYSVKFSPILFAKIGLLFFCWELFRGGFNKIKQKTLSLGEMIFWTLLTLVRNSNLFIAVPYIFLKLRNRLLVGILVCFCFTFGVLYSTWYDGLVVGISPSNWPWSLNYIKELLGIESNFVGLIATFLSRVILLFGAREKLHNLGIEPFLVWGIPALELFIYVLLACIQFFGFYVAMRYIFKRYGIASFALLVPLIFSILTVSHQRYLIPFIPICLFGISLAFNNRANKLLNKKE